jgi:hypothetical protein
MTNIKTNNVPRQLFNWYELSNKKRNEFSYVDKEDCSSNSFFRYKGQLYYLGNFMRVGTLDGWEGAEFFTMHSGVCVRFTEGYEKVVVGSFCS